jgi:EAL domain-containing protein (putative c-di-GMP-specific phosphodiesterase class I)
VLRAACAQLARWDELAGPAPAVSVNVSARQLADPRFPMDVADALATAGLAPHRLTLEITESVVMADLDTSRTALELLHGLGVTLAIDDFGTGYSSLSYLRDLPFDELKIDKAFIDGVPTDRTGTQLVEGILAMAGTLHLQVVAEGVEDASQAAHLDGLGCELAQGYHFARPCPADEVLLFARCPTSSV